MKRSNSSYISFRTRMEKLKQTNLILEIVLRVLSLFVFLVHHYCQ